MLEIPLLGKFLAFASSRRLDDLVDRLHFESTVWLLILFAMFIGGKQHFGQPIQCMMPTHMDRGAWTSYGQYYCFITNTYRLTYNKTIPNAAVRSQLREKEGVTLAYYQWVPYFLVIQAFCFYIPSWLWRLFQSYSYMDMQAIVDEAVEIRNEIKMEKREERTSKLVDFLSSSLCFHGGFCGKLCSNPSKCWSGHLAVPYLLSKVIMIINDFAQLYLIAYFLGIKNVTWALHPFLLSQKISSEGYNFTASYFPRVTFCDLNRATLSGTETNTLQCIVMLNVINEKIFLILFYWIAVLIAISIANFVYVSFNVFFHHEASVKFYIQSAGDNENDFFLKTDRMQLLEFVNNALRYDGVLLLHFLNAHAGAIVTRDIVGSLWRSYITHLTVKKSFEVNTIQPLHNATIQRTKDQRSAALNYTYGTPHHTDAANISLRYNRPPPHPAF